jgi:hypothetical protein
MRQAASFPRPPHIDIKGGTYQGQTFNLGHNEYVDFISGGAVLEDCVLDVRGAGWHIIDATLKRCRIRVRRQMSNQQFTDAQFEDCVFEGKYVGCEFGRPPFDHRENKSYYRQCDFSAAKLMHLCAFYRGDIDSVLWPAWPCFVVLHPWQNRDDWLAIRFPPDFVSAQDTIVDEPGKWPLTEFEIRGMQETRRQCQAVTVDLRREEGCDPDEMWALIQDKEYITFQGKEQKPRVSAQFAAEVAAKNEKLLQAWEAEYQKRSVWGELNSTVIANVERRGPSVFVHVDTSCFHRPRDGVDTPVYDAPVRVIVELVDCTMFVHVTDQGTRDMSLHDGEFKLQGASVEGDDVIVRPFGKRMGEIRTRYRECIARNARSKRFDAKDLGLIQRRWWGLAKDG